MEPTVAPRRAPALLALSDAVAILIFATVGLSSHHHGLSPTGYARDALPILGCWFAAALLFRTYTGRRWRPVLATWAVGVPLGVLVRAVVLGRAIDGKEAVFLGVALVSIGLFVVLLRTAVAFAGPR